MMLYGLPASYENFRVAIEARDKLLGPAELKTKILEESEAQKNKNDSNEGEGAYYTKKNIKFCKNCRKKGHNTESYWSKRKHDKKDAQPKKQDGQPSTSFTASKSLLATEANEWCLDSGCTSHMTGRQCLFSNIKKGHIMLGLAADNQSTEVLGKGTVAVTNNERNYDLKETLYVKQLATNLLSVGKITDNGFKVIFEKDKAYIIEKGKPILTAKKKNGLYYLPFHETMEENANTATQNETLQWHKKLGHVSNKDLKQIVRDELLRGVKLDTAAEIECETCIKGKMTRVPFQKYDTIRTQEPLEIIHSDVCGPFEIEESIQRRLTAPYGV